MTIPGISPDLKRMADAALAKQRANPQSECFITYYVDEIGWLIMSAKSGIQYNPQSFFEKFGYHPELQHPEILRDAVDRVVRKPKPSNHKPKGFRVKKT